MKVNNKIKAVVLFLGIVCVLYGTKRLYPVRPSEGPRDDGGWGGYVSDERQEAMQMSGMFATQPDIRWPAETGGGGRGFGKSY